MLPVEAPSDSSFDSERGEINIIIIIVSHTITQAYQRPG